MFLQSPGTCCHLPFQSVASRLSVSPGRKVSFPSVTQPCSVQQANPTGADDIFTEVHYKWILLPITDTRFGV